MATYKLEDSFHINILEIKQDSILNLLSLKTVESMGTTPPTMLICFETKDYTLRDTFYKGKLLTISMSRTQNESPVSIEYMLTKVEPSSDGKILTMVGVMNLPQYTRVDKISSYQSTSVDAISSEISSILVVDTKNPNMIDSQVWIRAKEPMKQFIENTILHSRTESGGVLMTSITNNGTFLIRDSYERVFSNYEWRFLDSEIKDDKDIHVGRTKIELMRSSFYDHIAASGFTTDLYDTQKGSYSTIETSIDTNFLSHTNYVDPNLNLAYHPSSIVDNAHANYPLAALDNKVLASRLLRILEVRTFMHGYHPIKPLDNVLNLVKNLDFTMDEHSSGQSLVYSVTRELIDMQLYTTVLLIKENLSGGS